MRTPLLFFACLMLMQVTACSSNKTIYRMSETDILQQLAAGKDVVVENKTIERLDFTQMENATLESPVIQRHYVNGSLTFINCDFKGALTTYSADKEKTHLVTFMKSVTFLSCHFKDMVSFREVTAYGKVNFSGSDFQKTASFEGSHFLSDAAFGKANFADEARFQFAAFDKLNFMDAGFDKTVSFQGAVFGRESQFSNVHFRGYADFSLVQFNGHGFFNYCIFDQQAVFSNAYFRGRFDLMQSKLNGNAEFRNSYFLGQTRFNSTTASGVFNLEGAVFPSRRPEWTSFAKGEKFTLRSEGSNGAGLEDLK
ncbi:MAG: pentapeptide repeat-containing protein [Chitinophagales bacterium]